MNSSPATNVAALILRIALGTLFLAHDAVKIFIFTPAGTVGFFHSLGLPAELAYLVMTAELVGGLMLIFGIWTRWAALALIPLLLGTILFVHGANGWLFTNKGGGWEYPAFWSIALLVQALIGDGVWALRPSPART